MSFNLDVKRFLAEIYMCLFNLIQNILTNKLKLLQIFFSGI